MRQLSIPFFLSLCLAAASTNFASAQQPAIQPSEAAPPAVTNGPNDSTAPATTPMNGEPVAPSGAPRLAPAGKKAAVRAPLPERMASFMVGSVAGVPIAMYRHTRVEVVLATKELVDNSNNRWLLTLAAPIGIAGGLVSGACQGLLASPYNAWKSRNHPFGPGTFSLPEPK